MKELTTIVILLFGLIVYLSVEVEETTTIYDYKIKEDFTIEEWLENYPKVKDKIELDSNQYYGIKSNR